MLACLVHKDCKDISNRPTELPPGRTRVEAREDSRRTLEGERKEAKSKRAPEQLLEIEHSLKRARVVGMNAQAAQIAMQTIQTQMYTYKCTDNRGTMRCLLDWCRRWYIWEKRMPG